MPFWRFKNLSDEEVELRIEGEVVDDLDAWLFEWFGDPYASPNKFRQELKQHRGKTITMWVDSWGGDVFAGVGIYEALKSHKGKIIAKVVKAVSAASLPIMAAHELYMSPGGIVMIHNAWTRVVGEAKDMRKTADVLDEVKEAILNIYQSRVKTKSREEISRMMDNEEWMSAKKAVAEGFADGILHSEDEGINASYSISGLAIQNSATAVMQRFFEHWQQKQQKNQETPDQVDPDQQPDPPEEPVVPQPEETPSNRVFDIQRRISVREKSLRRYV